MCAFKPVKLSAVFKDYLWGGTKLKTEFGKRSDLETVAESWELSTHKDGQSMIASGEDSGLSLSEYIDRYGRELLGTNAERFDYFPILIKLIDAKENLSIQVHPGDEYALRNEGEYGKTELWYVLEAEKGSSIFYGFSREVTKEEYAERIKDNTILDVLNKVQVKKGDVFFINSGTVHSIGKGIVICEIQQNSNTIYRVYDYDRRDKDGNARELHVEKAIEVSTLKPVPDNEKKVYPAKDIDGGTVQRLAECSYFTVDKYDCMERIDIPISLSSFKSILVIEGSGTLSVQDTDIEFDKGDSVFVPAEESVIKIVGGCSVIVSYV